MSRSKLLPLALPLALVLAAAAGCTDDKSKADTGTGTPDSGEPPDSGVMPDSGEVPDAGPPDSGPLPCQRDQGGIENRGCDPGMVCNLAMDPPTCVPGKACTTDSECNSCSDLVNPEECGHGYHLTAWCDPNHGNVCTRSRAPCEPCETNADCGRVHPIFGGMNTCVEYSDGAKFCGRPCTQGCPDGFSCNAEQVCIRQAGCTADPVICEQDPNGGADCGRMAPAQICPGVECADTGGAKCSTNDLPGALGVCIGFCEQNSDCPPETPICNPGNGICIAGCTKGSCSGGRVCHVDGFCADPCADDADCTENAKYGPDTYCNIPPPPARPPPRYYKGGTTGYRDDYSCAPLGCERNLDCMVSGIVCDTTQLPPACVPGCHEDDDCLAAEVCRRGEQRNYSEQECRMLEMKEEGMAELGVCCDPGCQDLNLDCGFNEWCCGEVGSPYEDPGNCLSPTSTITRQALPGECFEMGMDPWCRSCDTAYEVCDPLSGWTPGFAEHPFGSGNYGQEDEMCIPIAMGANVCAVTCNPENTLNGVNACPRTWQCEPFVMPCFQDADCNGLTCVGADMANMVPGGCRCGENGQATAVCPDATLGIAFSRGRCVAIGENLLRGGGWPAGINGGQEGEFYCVGAYNCRPPPLQVDMTTGETNYPASCGF